MAPRILPAKEEMGGAGVDEEDGGCIEGGTSQTPMSSGRSRQVSSKR